MTTSHAEPEVDPFATNPGRPATEATVLVLMLVIATVIGYRANWLTEALAITMCVFGCWRVVCGCLYLHEVRQIAAGNHRDWLVLQQCNWGMIFGTPALEEDAFLLMRAAKIVLGQNRRCRKTNIPAAVAAVLADINRKFDQHGTTGYLMTQTGLAGTCVGLIILFGGIQVGADAEAFAASSAAAVGGMKMAVATTLIGVLFEKIICTQTGGGFSSITELGAQMEAQLSLLDLGDE